MRENNCTEHVFQAAGATFQLTAAPARPVAVPGAGGAVPARAGGAGRARALPLPFCELQLAGVPGNAKCLG